MKIRGRLTTNFAEGMSRCERVTVRADQPEGLSGDDRVAPLGVSRLLNDGNAAYLAEGITD